jgi:cytochrome P450
MANLDVTTHVITWMITLIADNENAKRELREEVAANRDRFHEYLARTDTHLHYCFYESMRLRPATSKSISSTSNPIRSYFTPQL